MESQRTPSNVGRTAQHRAHFAAALATLLTLASLALVTPAAAQPHVAPPPQCHLAGTTGLTALIITQSGQTVSNRFINATGCDLGVYAGPGTVGVSISGNYITGANDHAVFLQDSNRDLVSGNLVIQNGNPAVSHSCNYVSAPCIAEDKAIQLSGTSHSVVANNFVFNNSADGGIGVSDDSSVLDPGAPQPGHNRMAVANVVYENYISANNGGCGIVVAGYNAGLGVRSTTVIKNQVYGQTQVEAGGFNGLKIGQIVIATDGPNTSVLGTSVFENTVIGSELPGIVLHANAPGDLIQNTKIVGNTVSDNSGYPAFFASPNTPLVPTAISIVAEAYGFLGEPVVNQTSVVSNHLANDAVGVWICTPGITTGALNTYSNVTTSVEYC